MQQIKEVAREGFVYNTFGTFVECLCCIPATIAFIDHHDHINF